MKVQEYLKINGLQKLQNELKIKVREYQDRIVLNYDQIESPKNDPIVQECRALILRKDENWSVMAQAYLRFLNVGEDQNTAEFPLTSSKTRVYSKIDGSIILLYWDNFNNKWQPSSRSCAFGEGESVMGNTFANIFYRAIENTNVIGWLESNEKNKEVTWIFELCSPETRVVTPFSEYKVVLTGARNVINGQELYGDALDMVAIGMKVERPESFSFASIDEAIEKANSLSCMSEGFVLCHEEGVSFWRIKVKNSKYLAIANMRANGSISAKRILLLIVTNEQEEYLQYFKEDKKYFDYVSGIWTAILDNIASIHEKNCNIEAQKDYALAIMKEVNNPWESGILFEMRKKKVTLAEVVKNLDANGVTRLAKIIKLKERMAKEFGIKMEEEE
jgi:hypothetical protein